MIKLAKLWEEFQHNWDIYTVIIGSIVVGIISFILSTLGRTDITPVISLTLTMLGLVAISLRRDRQLETKIRESLLDVSGAVSSLNNNRSFSYQHDAYRFLIDVINKDGAKEAVFLQYSCRTSLDVLRTVLNKGAKVTLFLQHEDIAAKLGSQYQADRIKVATKTLRTDLNGSLKKPDKLKVYKYRAPGSVSGIKIDDRVLCMAESLKLGRLLLNGQCCHLASLPLHLISIHMFCYLLRTNTRSRWIWSRLLSRSSGIG